MNETLELLKEFAVSPTGRTVLIVVGVVVLLSISVPLWRAAKYLFRGLLWALLVVFVLALGAFAVWVWMKRETDDPARMEALERQAVSTLRGGWTNSVQDEEEEEEED